MGVYEDMANDAGYPYGTPENKMLAQEIERQQMMDDIEKFQEFQDRVDEELFSDIFKE